MRRFTLIITCLVFITSCRKFLSIPPPKTEAETAVVFHDEGAALSALAGLYSEMGRVNLSMSNGGQTLYAGLLADELVNSRPNEDLDAFCHNAVTPTTTIGLGRLWNQAFRTIYHANAILEGLEDSDNLPESIVRQITGEALVIRAFHYFNLLNFFGNVPYVTGTDFQENGLLPRTDTALIYKHLEQDLLQASDYLAWDYQEPYRTSINKWTAESLLSRVYLYEGKWDAAATTATEVIQSGMYTLTPDPGDVFLPQSQEVIWQLSRDNYNTAEGLTFVPASSRLVPNYVLRDSLVSIFESQDKRSDRWIGTNTISGKIYAYPFKYKLRTNTTIGEYYVIFRLAEQYLIRAEAYAHMHQTGPALADVNIIRERAGLNDTTASANTEILPIIYLEREKELFAEWGNRWFDLKRTGRANAVLSRVKGDDWDTTDILLPLPQAEIEANPVLVQNPGY